MICGFVPEELSLGFLVAFGGGDFGTPIRSVALIGPFRLFMVSFVAAFSESVLDIFALSKLGGLRF